ncbi:Shedu immune nuclease family protein [Vibrio crassostreae]|uniref:Shedu immune nuclease family protein n=1 Tax=Vibrio crassostreae TaxID=246167 RepID=UPI001B30702C|nr:Shedu immune nuclease family protein [Vibrio crassostreae]CAK2691322.1 Shedu protein SduA C-terminal domain-containing protein [Vibrio crassostreae]
MDKVSLTSTSWKTAVAEPIEIRLKETIRLVFVPTVVNNEKDIDACVKGHFVYQKKKKADGWEDVRELNLSQLKPAEGVKLELKSAELLLLLRKLADLYRIHRKDGIQRGSSQYVKLSGALEGLCNATDEDLRQFIELSSDNAVGTFKRIAKWLSSVEYSEKVVESLESLSADNIKQLNVVAGLTVLKKSLDVWENNKYSTDEEFWQRELTSNSFVLSQIFSFPVVVVKEKAYIGGKTFTNQGGNIVDFLYKNELTSNPALIEIKTPSTRLIASAYRQTFNMSKELTGSTSQVLNYANSIIQDYYSIVGHEANVFGAYKPTCVVIIGNASELDSPDKRKAFELYRNNLKDVQIITFDELYGKVSSFIKLLENGN